jgi:hypothetical protein
LNPYVRNDAVTQYNAAPGYNVTQIQLTNERVYILTSDSIMRCVTKSLAGPVGVYNSFSVFGICAISENEVYVATYYSPSYTLRRLAYNGSTAFGNVWVLSSLPANSCSYVWKTSKALYFCGLTSTGWYKVIGDGAGFDLVYPLSANYVSPVVINDKFAIVNNTTTGGSNFLTVYDESL